MIGFDSMSSMPAARQRSSCPAIASAVNATIGVGVRRLRSRECAASRHTVEDRHQNEIEARRLAQPGRFIAVARDRNAATQSLEEAPRNFLIDDVVDDEYVTASRCCRSILLSKQLAARNLCGGNRCSVDSISARS